MYQAAHRVRPLLNKRRIVVTCAIPLANLEPTTVSYCNRKNRTMDKLREAARRLIQEQGYFSRQDLAHEAGVNRTTVGRHWYDLIEIEGLKIEEIAVPSDRYPGGRITEAAAG
jgi:predicted HTH transcriptional regulator